MVSFGISEKKTTLFGIKFGRNKSNRIWEWDRNQLKFKN